MIDTIEKHYMTAGPCLPVTGEGTVLTVGGYAVDLAARQQDVAVVVDLLLMPDGSIKEGRSGGWYAANVMIPPARYHEAEDGIDPETEQPIMVRVQEPLDMNLVVLNLWGLPHTESESEEE